MRRTWVWGAAVATVVLPGVAWLMVNHWLGTADFRERVQTQGSQALGATLTLQSLSVSLWPQPAVAIEGLRVASSPAITAQQIELRPDWLALLRGDAAIASLVVREAVVPQRGVAALMAGLPQTQPKSQRVPAAKPGASAEVINRWLPRSVVLDGLTLINDKGVATTVQGQLTLGADGWPRTLKAQILKGRLQGTRLELAPQPFEAVAVPSAPSASSAAQALQPAGRSWRLSLALGGGTVQGPVMLKPPATSTPRWVLSARLQTRDVEVSALTAPNAVLSGKLEAETNVEAAFSESAEPSQALAALLTQTRFTVRNALVNGLDLAQAVKTVGLSRGGQTRLDTLAGQVKTRGQAVEISQLVASSGVLTATGQVSISPSKTLNGRINVDLAAGSLGASGVGVPLQVSGTLDQPQVSLTRAALLGAAVGTVVMPGVGTGAGATLGDRVGEGMKKLFGR